MWWVSPSAQLILQLQPSGITCMQDIDALIEHSLSALAADPHVKKWKAKEHNWVSYFVFRHLVQHCRPNGVISHPAQIGIEVGVPQPNGYRTASVRRDVVIWPDVGMTCWNDDWMPSCHPFAIIEWKVHRPRLKNRFVDQERAWLRSYCRWQPSVAGYAIEVDGGRQPATIMCDRFRGAEEIPKWREFRLE
jgi:hypothetical protein